MMLIQNKPMEPLTTDELDDVYSLPYMRTYHPIYEKDGEYPVFLKFSFQLLIIAAALGLATSVQLHFIKEDMLLAEVRNQL